MASTKCTDCGGKLTPFNRNPSSPNTCQNCGQHHLSTGDGKEIIQENRESINSGSVFNVGSPELLKSSDKYQSHEVKVAIQSARIVNTYGSLIQVAGVIFGLINAAGGFYLTNYSGDVVWVVAGVLFGLAVIFFCAVQGALFRMISNYVVARLKN